MRPILIAIVLILTIAGPVAADDQLPFHGRLNGTVTVTPLDPPVASVVIDATGTATRLGQFELSIPHLVNQANRTAAGTYVFTAANGDTLTASFTGQAMVVSPGVISTTETATFTGGTGRFAGATGGFTATRLFLAASGTTSGSFDGVIDLP